MTEADEDTNAKALLLLDEKVRELVRKHLKEALEDSNFLYTVHPYDLVRRLHADIVGGLIGDGNFSVHMARAIGHKMSQMYY